MASGEAGDLESNGTKPKVTKPDKLKQKIEPNHHRMYRSPVRPFFCCGSQISLNSITEIKDGSPVDKTDKENDDDYEDIATDSDDLLEESSNLAVQQSPKKYDRTSPRLNRTSLTWKRKKTASRQEKSTARKKFWSLKLKGKLQVSKGSHYASSTEIRSPSNDRDICVCTSFVSKGHVGNSTSSLQGAEGGLESRIDDEFELYSSQPQASTSRDDIEECSNLDRARGKGAAKNRKKDAPLPFINLNKLYPINDIDEQLIAQRRHEMEHGIEVEDVWILKTVNGDTGLKHGGSVTSIVCSTNIKKPVGQYPSYGAMALLSTEAGMDPSDVMAQHNRDSMEEGLSCSMLNLNMNPWVQNVPNNTKSNVQCHTQVDYIHFLVPDLDKIVRSSFYWGVMDRYQAEKLIENKAEGTFLLRDSAQDEFLFSVSFRRYGRSLHARIEQWNHKFSFDSRDPGVYATDTVCGLIDHYKDPSCCMFFEPMLTLPLNRTFPFSLQHLARAEICSRITYDGISKLTLPRSLKEYLQFYHYKQKIRVRRFDNVA